MVSSPNDPHDPDNELDRQDNLTLMALGEEVDAGFTQHQSGCPRCRAELAALTATVDLARSGGRNTAEAQPSDAVWENIRTAVARPPGAGTGRQYFQLRRTAVLLMAAAVVALLVGVGGFLLGRDVSSTGPGIEAHAVLAAQPGGPAAVTGTAQVTHTSSGYAVSVSTHSLPIRTGYYAVWVYDPTINHMINIGALNGDGAGTFTLPPGTDIHDYDIIDVSAQNFDGNPAHQQSVLRGPLTK